jgi:hypothetical protein
MGLRPKRLHRFDPALFALGAIRSLFALSRQLDLSDSEAESLTGRFRFTPAMCSA